MPESEDNSRRILSEEELKRLQKLHETPIDVEQLIEDGILERVTRQWYRVLDFERLPEHVRARVNELRNGREGAEIKITPRMTR